MIVRILGEGQFRVSGVHLDMLNGLDDETVRAVEAGDETAFRQRLGAMLAFVRDQGAPLPLDEIKESDVILPNQDITLAEAWGIFSGEGAIPD